MSTAGIHVLPVTGIPEIQPGDELGAILANAVRRNRLVVGAGAIFVIAQKIVSKAEGRIVLLDAIKPSAKAAHWAAEHHKDPRLIELVLRESRRIVRMERGVLIVETPHGFICANGGVDASNTPPGAATLLPEDPDASARRLQQSLSIEFHAAVGVIVSDSFGRPWREGLVNVAIGVAGLVPLLDYRGKQDDSGRPLQATVLAVADELASAAELVMGKSSRIPVALIQGFSSASAGGSARDLLRSAENDLFR